MDQNYTVNPSFGAIINVETPNQHGAISYLIATQGTTWMMIDPWDGELGIQHNRCSNRNQKLRTIRRTNHLPNQPRKQMVSTMELHTSRKQRSSEPAIIHRIQTSKCHLQHNTAPIILLECYFFQPYPQLVLV